MDTDEKVGCLPDNLGKHKKPRLKKAYIVIGAFSVTFILFTMLVLPIFDDRRGIDILFSHLGSDTKPTVDVGEEVFNNTANLGWEYLDNNNVIHAWNTKNDYYFNASNGVQFGNHYQEYWTQNVLMAGYFDGEEWNLIYRTDELSGFNKQFNGSTDEYMNLTLWKDLSYGSYDFRLAIRYHLGVNDSDLTIVPYIKNLGIEIPYVLGFGWELKDIKIADVTNDNYLRIFNGTGFEDILLNQTLDETFTDMDLNTSIKLICTNPPSPYLSRNLYLSWDSNLTYKVTAKSRANQYNAPVTLFIKVGTLAVGQEKFTELHWLDADDWLGISSAEYDSHCGEDSGYALTDALDGIYQWKHFVNEVHWFVLDLGQTYTIKKIQVRSLSSDDPTDVNIYIDDSNPPTTLCEEGISTWRDTDEWVEIILTTEGTGRYIKVEIEDTEDAGRDLRIGALFPSFTIFDAYGDVAGEEEETWQVVNNTVNGAFTNLTVFQNVNTSINGAFTNLTVFQNVNTSVNGEFTNLTVFRNVNTSINGEFTNLTIFRDVNTSVNGEFTNVSIRTWQNVNTTINGTFTNTTTWQNVNTTVNGAFTNTTVWRNVNTSVNGIFTNATVWQNVDTSINGEFTNTSTKTWQNVNDTINGVFTNTTAWQNVNISINGIFTNTTVWYNVDTTYNGEFTNTTVWQNVDVSINGEFTNTSIRTWQVVNNTVNGAFTNTTLWYNVDVTYNGEFTNTTTWQIVDNTINGVFTNVTVINITITYEYPTNGSTNIPVNTSLHFMVNNTLGYVMNITVYTGSNMTNCSAYLGSFNSVNNGTYYLGYHNASNVSTQYAWRVNVTDAYGNYAQETYNFTTASTTRDVYLAGVGRYSMGMLMAFSLLFALGFSSIIALLWRKRKRRDIY